MNKFVYRIGLVFLSFISLCSAQSVPAAGNSVNETLVVFYLDQNNSPITRIDRLGNFSPAMKAILALYALENGAGCEGKIDGDKIKCDMTQKLGLGANCSIEHIELVRSWFDVTPKLTSRWNEHWNAKTKVSGSLENLCYSEPWTGSWYNTWEIIKVKKVGSLVEVQGIVRWGTKNGHGRIRYQNTYKVEQKRIVEIAARITVLSESAESAF